ncbi:MSHA biogenesis protein MshK [Undibacterium sp. Xuan67W]|uniref:MSHA biogenesis protein MshK n=1 Tax=Undibacterium sp. Xuan67W TaxID=3413057 RepID=UPI003BEFD4FF
MAQFMIYLSRNSGHCSRQTLIPPIVSLFMGLSLLSQPALVAAQSIPDPTRPPDTLLLPATTGSNEIAAGPVLQSVLISPSRRLAIISGKTLGLNDKFNEQTVIKINETEVVLRNGKELQTLKLFPDFEKKPTRASNTPPANAKK